ncbi:MAG: hypothetical protein A2038_06960 [Deltaproteobacteria bacterium GWA2_57_13]|nr:MAG: hypothetical protein A2038_06960 [Deltaproteobacteria bacterium GWA2_57_13]
MGVAVGGLSLIVFLPTVGAVVMLLIPRAMSPALFKTALAFTLMTFLWSLRLLWGFDPGSGEMQFV